MAIYADDIIRDLGIDIADMEQTIEGLGIQVRDLEQAAERKATAVQDAIDSLHVLTEVPLSELDASVQDIIEQLRKAL